MKSGKERAREIRRGKGRELEIRRAGGGLGLMRGRK